MVDKNKAKNIEAGNHSNVIQGNNNIITTIINHIPDPLKKLVTENIGGSIFTTALIVAAILNPSAETQARKIKQGIFKSYELHKQLFYENYFVFSCIYTISNEGDNPYKPIPLSYGLYGITFESIDFSYNQFILSDNPDGKPRRKNKYNDFSICGSLSNPWSDYAELSK